MLRNTEVVVEVLANDATNTPLANATPVAAVRLAPTGVGAGRARVRALSDLSLRVGDAVVLGIHEDLLLRASVLFYLFPLLGFFVAALLATRAGLVEPLIIVSGLAGLLAAWLLVRRHARRHADDPASQPVVLRALISGPSDSA